MNSALFTVNEKVLVPHTDKFYEAKITKMELREDVWFYFLHYTGWNKKYDEWVEESGLSKCQQTATEGGPPPAPGKKSRITAVSAPGAVSVIANTQSQTGKKRPLLDVTGAAAQPTAAAGAVPGAGPTLPQLELDIPPLLKKALLDDYEAIVEERKLVPLPRSPNVAEMLQMYVQQALAEHGSAEAEEEACHGLRMYFDKALHVALLYQSERSQEMLVLANGRVASSVYGPEHFLRLLVKLPDLLATAMVQLSEEQMKQIAALVQDLMLWLCEQPALMLSRDKYVVPST